jgi:hypothetical protein
MYNFHLTKRHKLSTFQSIAAGLEEALQLTRLDNAHVA